MKLIVGLGNPGNAYTRTRHNIGFLVVEKIAQKREGKFHKACDGLVARIDVDGHQCSLLMPQTMMNNSGVSVNAAATKFGVPMSDVLVVYDDMAIAFGSLRVRASGSSGGHNGIKSIIAHVGGQDFPRLRLGIGQPPVNVDAADYVLAKFTSGEQECLPDFINKASLAVHCWVTQGVDAVMNEYNGSNKQKESA